MPELQRITVILFLSVIYFIQASQSVEVIKQTDIEPKKQIFYNDKYSFEDDRILYVACDKNAPAKCKVVQKKYPFINVTRSCDVELPLSVDLSERQVTTIPFGENKVILFWDNDKEDESAQFAIIHLDDCRKYELKISYSGSRQESMSRHLLRSKNIVAYKETFDIFFRDDDCSKDHACRLTINARGEIVEGPVEHEGYREVYPVASNSGAKGHIWGIRKIFLTRPNASAVELESVIEIIKTSIVEEVIGSCKRDSINSNITCSQFTSDGKLKFRFALNDIDNKTQLFNIYTIPNEGFFLQFLQFEKCQRTNYTLEHEFEENVSWCSGVYGSTVMKVDAAGKTVGKFEVQQFDKFAFYPGSHFWKNTEKEGYCSFLVSDRGGGDTIDILSNCFTDADFSA